MSVYLALGSNLGDRERNLIDAIERLSEVIVTQQISAPYDTGPVGYIDQPRFMNAVVRGETKLTPEDLLDFVKKIEVDLGRTASFVNGPRLVDIDILLYDDVVLNTPLLTIPHPRYTERAFVLIPLSEIGPDTVCPLNQITIKKLAEGLGSADGVIKGQWTRR